MPDFREKASFADVHVVDMTNLAIKVDIEGKHYWLPQSQIDDDSEVWQMGDEGVLVVSEFIAIAKGLV